MSIEFWFSSLLIVHPFFHAFWTTVSCLISSIFSPPFSYSSNLFSQLFLGILFPIFLIFSESIIVSESISFFVTLLWSIHISCQNQFSCFPSILLSIPCSRLTCFLVLSFLSHSNSVIQTIFLGHFISITVVLAFLSVYLLVHLVTKIGIALYLNFLAWFVY